ncbi:MAG: hypothetical protein H3C69_09915 [Candidatus Promineofilum sp.]|nr:hypothetical protein [Promineifilum sp.]
MADLTITGEIARRLREIAEQEQRPVEDVLRAMLANYEAKSAKRDPLQDFVDAFSGKDLDISKMVRSTAENHYRKKYGDSD